MTHEIELRGHVRVRFPCSLRLFPFSVVCAHLAACLQGITAIAIEPSGSRVVTGSSDSNLNFYDFNGLNAEHTPFRSLDEPCGSYPVCRFSHHLSVA